MICKSKFYQLKLADAKIHQENKKYALYVNKGNNKITELRTILQRESQNSYYINRQNQSTTGKL